MLIFIRKILFCAIFFAYPLSCMNQQTLSYPKGLESLKGIDQNIEQANRKIDSLTSEIKKYANEEPKSDCLKILIDNKKAMEDLLQKNISAKEQAITRHKKIESDQKAFQQQQEVQNKEIELGKLELQRQQQKLDEQKQLADLQYKREMLKIDRERQQKNAQTDRDLRLKLREIENRKQHFFNNINYVRSLVILCIILAIPIYKYFMQHRSLMLD